MAAMAVDQPPARPTLKEYEGEGIVVTWEPTFCIHAQHCVRGLPTVFDRDRRPWIEAGAAEADRIAEVIERCPSGALGYRRTDGRAGERVAEGIEVDAEPNGPLHLRGRIRIADEAGRVIREATRVTLCRCGQSANKPFCDRTHERVGWRSS
jgi:uncharacterized Fe-S cluster protein YjdI